MERLCENCGKRYEAERSTSRFCSSACRVIAFRAREERAVEELAEALTPVPQGSLGQEAGQGSRLPEPELDESRFVEFEGELRLVVREADLTEDGYVAREIDETRRYAAQVRSSVPLEDRLKRTAAYARWRYRGFLCGEVASL